MPGPSLAKNTPTDGVEAYLLCCCEPWGSRPYQPRFVELLRVLRNAVDQVEDYARRKGMEAPTVEKWLRPVLGYEPKEESEFRE